MLLGVSPPFVGVDDKEEEDGGLEEGEGEEEVSGWKSTFSLPPGTKRSWSVSKSQSFEKYMSE